MAAALKLDDRIARHEQDLLRFLQRRVPGQAEEIAQETWLRVARSTASFEDERSFRAYAFTVARRLIIDNHRRRRARIQLVSMQNDDGEERVQPIDNATPDGRLAADEVLAVVQAELGRMKPEMADVFRMRMTEDRSFKEIAALQQVSLNTALGRMHRATKRIAQALRERGLAEGVP